MSEFHKEADHNAIALLFDSYNIEDRFNKRSSLPYKVVKDKEEKRLSGMLSSIGDLGLSFSEYQRSAIACVAIASSEEEYISISLGITKPTPQGITVCVGCLEKAIATCEENLAVLKDIQKAVKVYVE